MAACGGSITSLTLSAVYSALGENLKSAQPVEPKSNEHVNTENESPSNQIQQVGWSVPTMSNTVLDSSAATLAVKPQYQVVRDNAPSSTIVISLLIGIAVFSLLLGLASLPHHWLHGDSTRWRERKGW
jgi:hypothetical protein